MGRRIRRSSELLERRTTSFNPTDAMDTLDLLDMCVKALQDKRCSTRVKALAALAGALEQLPPLADELDTRCFSIFALCGVHIKNGEGSLKEKCLAFRAAGLLALNLRTASPGFLAQSFPTISRTLRDQDYDPTTVAALDCLAAVTFAGAQGREDVNRSMKLVWDLIFTSVSRSSAKISAGGASSQVLATAVSTWVFLLTTIVSVTDGHRKVWNATVASLAGLLEHDDRAVRMAAGEALAVCVELNLTQHATRKDMDALAAKVSELAAEHPGRGFDNAMLPEQKDLFRQIAAFLDHGERPDKSLPTSLEGCVALQVTTWTKLVQLNFLRRFLGNGFVKHVQGNELFIDAFSYGADEHKVLSVAKKKTSRNTGKDFKIMKRDRMWLYSNIFCDYPYTAQEKPETLLQIGWQKTD